MTGEKLIVYGAGGHGLVVAEAAGASGWGEILFFDDDGNAQAPEGWGRASPEEMKAAGTWVTVAVGKNETRAGLIESLLAGGSRLATVIHPSAVVSVSASVGEGVFVGPGAVIHARAKVEEGAIVNSGAIVEHHCVVGACAHVGPGAAMGGRVVIGRCALVGVGASIRPGVRIGEGAKVGVGAVVVRDVPAAAVVVGAAARARGRW